MLASDEQTEVPEAIWIAEAGQSVIQPAVIVGRSLLLATQDSTLKSANGRIQAFDLGNGSKRWQNEFEFAGVSGIQILQSASMKMELAIVTTSSLDSNRGQGSIVAIEESGKIRWHSAIIEDRFSAPHIQNGIIFVTSGANQLLMITPEVSKDQVRQLSLDVIASPSAPTTEKGTVFIPCQAPELLAVNQNGGILWHFQFQGNSKDWLNKTPAISAGRVFCSSSGGRVFALDAASGELLWRVSIGDGQALSEPVVQNGRIYVGTNRGLVALDIHNGWPLWTMETSRPVSATPLAFYDTLFVTSQDHHLYAVEAKSGREIWRYGLGRRIEMPPVIAQDILVVTDRGGMIVGFSGLSTLEIDRESNTQYETVQSDLRQKAQNYERKVQPLAAAALWMELGEIDRAALQYEAAKSWLEAANAWEKLANYGRRAGAFEQHALVLSNQDVDEEDKALAWEQATHAYRATTHKEARLRCEREVVRWRKQPLLGISANPGEMTLNRWMELEYKVINNGFGLASSVAISLKGERFEGESQQTLSSPTLGPGSEYTQTMRIRPTEQGNSVPLEFVIEFVDHRGKQHRYDSTIALRVVSDMPAESQAQSAITITQLSASSLAELARLPAGEHDLPGLYNKMVQYFSQTDLELIVIELGLVRDDFSPKLSLLTKELITTIARNGRLEELIEVCRSRRPNVVW